MQELTFLDVYKFNVLALASRSSIGEFGAYELGMPKKTIVQKGNPYIDNEEFHYPLGVSLEKNGTHWIFLAKNDEITEGGHRYEAMCLSKVKRRFPYIDITHTNWKDMTMIRVKPYKAEDINRAHRFETETVTISDINVSITDFLQIPVWLRKVLYEWEQKYGFYEPLEICNDYEKLKQALLERRKKR